MLKSKSINIYIVGLSILVILGLGYYFFISEKQKPSSIDDYISKVKKTKSPEASKISSKDLKKLEVSKVKTIDTKDPFSYTKKTVQIPKPVSEITANVSLNEIQVVGILKVGNTKFAIIKLPNNKVHKFVVGEYITKDAAKIYAIHDSQVVLLVTARDAKGAWITDKKVLKLQKKEKENL